MVGDRNTLRLIMKIPLKTTEQLFSLYELIALPTKIAEDKFVRYSFEYPYIGLSLSRRDYVRLSAADVQQSSRGSLRLCPANIPLYDSQTPSCKASLFFQTPGEGNSTRENHKLKSLLRKGLRLDDMNEELREQMAEVLSDGSK